MELYAGQCVRLAISPMRVQSRSPPALPQAQRVAGRGSRRSVEIVVARVAAAHAVPGRRLVPLITGHHLRSLRRTDLLKAARADARKVRVFRQVPVLFLVHLAIGLLVQLQRRRLRRAHPAEDAAWQQAQHGRALRVDGRRPSWLRFPIRQRGWYRHLECRLEKTQKTSYLRRQRNASAKAFFSHHRCQKAIFLREGDFFVSCVLAGIASPDLLRDLLLIVS